MTTKRQNLRADSTEFRLAEHTRLIYTLNTFDKCSEEELMEPDFYAEIAAKLKPFYKIEIRGLDNSFYAEVLVIQADKEAVKVKLEKYYDFSVGDEKKDETKESGYIVSHKGANKWCVIRNSDSKAIIKGLDTEQDAYSELKEYLMKIGK